MPATPITFNITKGAGAPLPVDNATLLMGPALAGTDNAIVKVANVAALQEEFGDHGALIELASLYLSISRRPLYVMRVNDSVAATVSAVGVARADSSTGTVATSGTNALDSYDVRVEVLVTGTVAATSAVVRISFDGGISWYAQRQIASTIAFAEFGVTLVFADAGGGPLYFEAGDIFTFTTTGPGVATADVQAALDAWIASSTRVRRIHVMGVSGASLHSAIGTRMSTAAGQYHFARVITETDDQGGGESVATWQAGVLADFNVEQERIAVVPGWVEIVGPVTGFQLRRPLAWLVGPRAAAIDIGQDVGEVALGALPGAVVSDTYPIPQDGRIYTAFEDRGYIYGQSYIGRDGGIYAAGGFLRVSSGDPYYRLPSGQVVDEACDQVYDVLLDYINAGLLANADGTILESEAQAIEARLNERIEAVLVKVRPQRISPAADGSYAVIDRTENIVTSRNLTVTIALTPKAFIDGITVNIGFALS